MRFQKPCVKCGELSLETYCATHAAQRKREHQQRRDNNPARIARKKQLYTPEYRKLSKAMRAAGGICWLCGDGERPADPWQTDHIISGQPDSPLALAHRSCNARRGNKPYNPPAQR